MIKFKSLFVIVLALFAMHSQAQIQGGVTVGAQLPMGDFGDAYNPGIGFHVQGKYLVNESIGVGLNVGYNYFGSDVENTSSGMLPITALLEYHFGTGDIKPYLGADVGLYNFSFKTKVLDEEISDSEMYFGFAPTGGVLYSLSDMLSLCANAKYNYVLSEDDATSWLGVNAGIIISLN